MHSDLNPTHFDLLWLIPLFPFIGALINGLIGKRMMAKFGPKANHSLAILMPALSFVVTVMAFVKLIGLDEHHRVLYNYLFPFIHVGFFDADMAFWFDPLSATLTLIITFIGTLIHVYSIGYMHGDKSYWRFFTYLNLFMGSMLLLVLGDNFLVMFIGWEGVGLCSYLLISFWFTEKANAVAGMKAFVVNRVGDFAFVLGAAFLFWGLLGNYSGAPGTTDGFKLGSYQNVSVSKLESIELERQSRIGFAGERKYLPPTSVRFDIIRQRVAEDKHLWSEKSPLSKSFWGIPLIALICILLFIGATGKSAQIPLFVWLPDAMAGPTPVSALIHAATMVTAGVYLVARLNFLFVLSPIAMTVVACVGALTALFAATIGLFQHDIKKVLAYSTVSQLGYMFIGVGVGAYWAGILHLLTHAVFKACLFLGSGSVILGCHHEQDMRKMGGLKKYMPLTHWTYFFACIAITTAPFFFLSNGFFSKDEILWKAFDAQHLLVPGWSIWIVGFIGAACTSFYMWRSYYMTFTGEYRGGQDDHGQHGDDDHGHHGGEPHESPRTMTWVLVALAALILPTAGLGFWPLIHIEPIFEHWLHPVTGASMDSLSWFSKGESVFLGLPPHTWEYILAGASVSVAMCGWLVARALYKDAKNPMPGKLLAVAGEIVPKVPLADHVFGMRLLRLAGASFFFAGGFAAVTSGSTLGVMVFIFGMLLTFILAIFGVGFCLADNAGLGQAAMAVTVPLIPMFLIVLGMQYFRDYQVELGFIPLALAAVQLFRALPKQDKAGWMRAVYQTIYNKYYVDEFYDWMIVRPSHWIANVFSNIDKKLIDGFVHFVAFMGRLIAAIDGLIDALVVDGLILAFARGIAACGNRVRQTQTGQIQTYLLGAAVGALALVFFNFLLF